MNNKVTVSVKVPSKVNKFLDKNAQKLGISKSQFTSNLLTEIVNKKTISHQEYMGDLVELQTSVSELARHLIVIEIDVGIKAELSEKVEEIEKGTEKLWLL